VSDGAGADNPIIARIQREAGVPDLVDVLADRLDPTDVQSLLLKVYRRRAAKVSAGQLLGQYERDRFVRPSTLAPALLTDVDRLAWSLLPDSYEAIELSPVCPLGANAAIATVDQNKVGSPDKLVNRYGEGYGLLRGMMRSTSARNKWVCSSVGNV